VNRLVLDLSVPQEYDKARWVGIVTNLCAQINQLSEGRIQAKYAASNTVPTASTVAYQRGDIIWDSSPVTRSSVAPGLAASYIRVGWMCTTPGTPGTFTEMRVLTGT
jgi:hypothetical protein